jgi:hypothetical protein
MPDAAKGNLEVANRLLLNTLEGTQYKNVSQADKVFLPVHWERKDHWVRCPLLGCLAPLSAFIPPCYVRTQFK